MLQRLLICQVSHHSLRPGLQVCAESLTCVHSLSRAAAPPLAAPPRGACNARIPHAFALHRTGSLHAHVALGVLPANHLCARTQHRRQEQVAAAERLGSFLLVILPPIASFHRLNFALALHHAAPLSSLLVQSHHGGRQSAMPPHQEAASWTRLSQAERLDLSSLLSRSSPPSTK